MPLLRYGKPMTVAIAGMLPVLLTPGAARAQGRQAQVMGTIVSIRGNILAVRPSLRPKMTRVAFGDKTAIYTFERASVSVLKPGMRVGMAGPYSEKDGFMPRFIEASEKPVGRNAERAPGLHHFNDFAWAVGNLKSIQPFVITDDAGTDIPAKLDNVQSVMHAVPGDRNSLLIGVRIEATGTLATDGVLLADSISPSREMTKAGTMFGTITAVRGGLLEVRPRYTSDIIKVACDKNCVLLRQINLDPDSIKVGDKVTFWGQQRNPSEGAQPKSSDLLAFALLLGREHYPAAEGADSGVLLTGRLASLDPVRLALPNGKTINIIIPAQMPVARLEPLRAGDLKPGQEAMLILSRRPDGRFTASSIVVDAPPFVGYGG